MVEIRWKTHHIPGVSNPANKPVEPPSGPPLDPKVFKAEVDAEFRFHYIKLAGDVFVRIRRNRPADTGKKEMYSIVRIGRTDTHQTKDEWDDVWKAITKLIPLDEAVYGEASEFIRMYKSCSGGIQM